MANLSQVIMAVTGGALSVIGVLLLIIFNDLKEEVKGLRSTAEALNLKIAVVVEKIESHEKEILKTNERIDRLEREGSWRS